MAGSYYIWNKTRQNYGTIKTEINIHVLVFTKTNFNFTKKKLPVLFCIVTDGTESVSILSASKWYMALTWSKHFCWTD